MKRINPKALLRFAVLTMVITISVLSGALLQAYAFDSGTEQQGSSATAVAVKINFEPAATSAAQTMVDVCSGDTLWSIASAHLPEGENVRSYIYQIKKVNHLRTSDLREGQQLVMP